jgi:hypothetical protein
MPLEPGIYFGLDQSLYHNDPALNASGIKAFIEHPLTYWQQSHFNPNRKRWEPTKDMKTGTAKHKLLLEEDTFFDDYCVIPKSIFDPNKAIINEIEYNKLLDQINVVRSMPKVYRFFNGGKSEVTIVYDDKNGIRCKTRHDYMLPFVTIDYKDIDNIDGEFIKRQSRKFGYAISNVLYLESRKLIRKALKEGTASIYSCDGKPIDEHWLTSFVESKMDDVLYFYQKRKPPYPIRIIRWSQQTYLRAESDVYNAKSDYLRAITAYPDGKWPVSEGVIEEFDELYGSMTNPNGE